MSGDLDGLRDRMAEVLPHSYGCIPHGYGETGRCICEGNRQRLAQRLLPVAAAWADERAAGELREAADELHVQRFDGDADVPPHVERRPDSFYAGIVRARIHLRARAGALSARANALSDATPAEHPQSGQQTPAERDGGSVTTKPEDDT